MPTNNICITDSNKSFDSGVQSQGLSLPSTSAPPHCTPYVRYATYGEKGEPEQFPRLHYLNSPTPDEADFVSSIYLLDDEQVERHEDQLEWDKTDGWAVSGRNIANELQTECENEGRVLYPVFIESDAEVALSKQAGWICEFINETLPVNPSACLWYYSGGRSIHSHVPLFATERTLGILRESVKDSEYDLDSQIYTRKPQFRLPGIEHVETELPKVRIDPDWSHERIVREATSADVNPPESFSRVLVDTFGRDVFTATENYLWTSDSEHGSNSASVDPGLNAWERYGYSRGGLHKIWKAHYAHPVSPYANAGQGNRSVLVAKVHDGPFAEKREPKIEREAVDFHVPEQEPQTFVPAQILQFWSCDEEYNVVPGEFRPVQLSDKDYPKFVDKDMQEGDFLILIGGQSRGSRLFNPSALQARAVAGAETFDEALETLELFGYETGEAGLNPSKIASSSSYSGDNGQTRAGKFQTKAERDGVESLSHYERLIVMLRQLALGGVEGTRRWFQEQYGNEYDQDITNKHIRSACEKYDWTPEYEA